MSQGYAGGGIEVFVEEGIWTPTLEADVTNPSVTYSQQEGAYVKIGRLVTIWWLIQLDVVSTQGSGTYQIAGQPFDFSTDHPAFGPIGVTDLFISPNNNVQIARQHATAAALISMIYDGTGGGAAAPFTNATETIGSGNTLQGEGHYLTDD